MSAKKRPFILALVFLSATFVAQPQATEPPTLKFGESTTREIKGGETNSFKIEIPAVQTARVEVEQNGVDVALAAFDLKGERFLTSESPSGVLGSDSILVNAVDAGVYRVDVTPSDPRAAVGKYTIKLAEIRPTTEQDRDIAAAAMKITKVADETAVLRQKGTREGRRQAIAKFNEVIELARIKRDKTWETVALITTGLLYEQLGEVQRSLDFYQRGLAMAREIKNRQYEGSAINNLAVGYLTLGEYYTSVSYLTQALALQTETRNRRGQGVVFNNLGTAHLMLGDAAKSEDFYRQALAVRREVKDERGEGFALNNLGQVFLQTGDYPAARDFLNQALVLRRRITDKQGEAVTLRNLGKLFYKIGNDQEAATNLKQSNELAAQLGDRRVEADTLYWLASIEARSGDVTKAIATIERGLGIIEQIRGEIVNPQLRTGYFSTVPQFYELYADLLVTREQKETDDDKDIELALQVSERARARTLVELLQEARIDIKKSADAKNLDELQENLNSKYRDRTTLLAGKPTAEQVAKITAEINSLNVDVENLQVKIRRENPAYADLAYGSALSASEIKDLLDDDTVLVEYKLGDTRSLTWLVTKDKVRAFTLPPRTEIEAIALGFYKSVSTGKPSADHTKLEKDLNGVLTGQIAKLIGKKRIAIVADGMLNLIPFAAMPGFANNEIVTLPSAGVLAELRRSSSSRKPSEKQIAIFADPVFESNDSRLTNKTSATEKPVAVIRVLRDFELGGELPRLLSSRSEALEIAALFPAKDVTVKLDFDASIDNATGDAMRQFRIVHFATHGLLDTKHPESSSLVFSMFGRDGKPRDGFMRLGDVYSLDLASDLVVLSACQTALGKDVRGEGLIGLTRGFMFAGTSRVVASLWKVDDAATAEFMKRFYRSLIKEKLTAAASLKKAQNELRSIPRFRSPFYWAGFMLQGDWR